MDFVQSCQYEIIQLLNSLDEVPQSSRQLRSPYPDGGCLFLYAFNYILICLDLVDLPDASPPFMGGALRDDDAMMVDEGGK